MLIDENIFSNSFVQDCRYAFQYTFKNNATQYANNKKKKIKNKVWTLIHDDIRGGSAIQYLTPPDRA